MSIETASLKNTFLHEKHLQAGASFCPFAGYKMPLQYSGLINEHKQVRNSAGLFDVSHMGLCRISGAGASELLAKAFTKDLAAKKDFSCTYGLFCNEKGGCIDDLIIYKENTELYWAVFNASNKHKDLEHLSRLSSELNSAVSIEAQFESHCMLALQGPKSKDLLGPLLSPSNALPEKMHFCHAHLKDSSGAPENSFIIAGSGYTGEEGYELFLPNALALTFWDRLFESTDTETLKACGLGCRDTLRLEMGYSLYGHELSENINPLEAGLAWALSLKDDATFIGAPALLAYKQKPKRKLVCLQHQGRQSPRQGMALLQGAQVVGEVSSGVYAPSLGHAIAMGIVDAEASGPFRVALRTDRYLDLKLCSRPFFKG